MELIEYIRLLRRWAWLLLLAAFVGGAVSFVVRSSQPPVYVASATIIIGNPVRDPNPNSGELRTAQDLTQTYAQLARTFNLREAVVGELGLETISPDDLGQIISTRILPQTSLLVIEAEYNDPILAADIANEVAQQLILTSPTNLSEDEEAQVAVASTQIEELSSEITSLRNELESVNDIIDVTQNEEALTSLNERRASLINQINQTSTNIAQFTSILTNIRQGANRLEIVEEARIPNNPTGVSLQQSVILGAIVSAALAFGLVLVLEYLNDTFRSSEEVARTLGLQILGVVSRIGRDRSKETYEGRLITEMPPMSRTTEEYHTIRANLTLSLNGNKQDAKIFVITSPSPREGKSTTASNLAVSLAQAGNRVLLIDADLRRPKVHEIFNLPNDKGLTSLLSGHPLGAIKPERFNVEEYDGIRDFIQEVPVPNLRVITSGFVPKNPSEILGGALMARWADGFRTSPNVDIVIFDTPPCLAVSDTAVLTGNIGAKVVLVIEAERTRRTSAIRALERFQNIQENIIGIVLNNANLRTEDYYGYDYTYYYKINQPPTAKTEEKVVS